MLKLNFTTSPRIFELDALSSSMNVSFIMLTVSNTNFRQFSDFAASSETGVCMELFIVYVKTNWQKDDDESFSYYHREEENERNELSLRRSIRKANGKDKQRDAVQQNKTRKKTTLFSKYEVERG